MKLYYNQSYGNEHLKRNIQMFSAIGIDCYPFTRFPKDLLFKKASFLYLNWYENIGSRNGLVALFSFLMRIAALLLCKIRGIKIVSSFHNREIHGNKYARLCFLTAKIIYKFSDKIVVFSKDAGRDLDLYLPNEQIEIKQYYIPPVNYIGVYPFVENVEIQSLKKKGYLTVLMIGGMKESYKNVALMIKVMNELKDKHIQLIIAGKTRGDSQNKDYRALIDKDANVQTIFRFIKDDEMAQFLAIADVVAVPYELDSVSNSGVSRLAFSYAKTVISPQIPSIKDIPSELIYTYHYTSKEEHFPILLQRLLDVYAIYRKAPERLKQQGQALKEYMEFNNSPEVIVQRYKTMFSGLKKQ